MVALDERRTERLALCRPRAADLDDLVRYNQNERVMATLGGVRSRDATREYLDRQLDHWERYGFGWWIVREARTGTFAGRGGLRHSTLDGCDEVEVGYGFLPEFWGQGLATELARASVRVAFVELQLVDLVAFTLPSNRASRSVMEKVGFRFERELMYADVLHVLYRLTAASWRSGDTHD